MQIQYIGVYLQEMVVQTHSKCGEQKNQGVMPPAEQRVNYMNIGWYVIGDSTPPSTITHSTISWTAEANLPLITLKIV